MPEQLESKAVEYSCRLFRRLLMAYPRAHREEYGALILQLFRDQCRDAWAATRTRGLIGFWLRALGDLLKTSVWEHLANVNRKKAMFNLSRSPSRLVLVFCSVFAAVFVLAVGGSIVITLLYPKTYASSSTVMVAFTVPEPSPDSSSAHLFPIAEFKAIQSHAVLSKASDALSLSTLWGKKYNNGVPLNESQIETIIRSRLELRSIRNTDVIEIRAFSDRPDEAAKLANAVAEAYRDFRAEPLAQNATAPMARRVNIINTAVPEPRAVRPNTPLNIFLGIVIGVFVGALSGIAAVGVIWFFGRLPGNTGSPGRPARSDLPA